MARGKFIIVLGSTGSGKSALIEHARQVFPGMHFVKSYITRTRRDALENASYEFISREVFEQKKKEDAFVEWAEFGGNLYGTLRSDIEEGLAQGAMLIKEMEVQGIRQMLQVLPREDVKLLFVDAGSWEELAKRAQARSPLTDEELALRKKRFEDEQPFREVADVVIANPAGKLDEAKTALVAALHTIENEIS